MLCFDKLHQGIGALQETIEFLGRENAMLRAERDRDIDEIERLRTERDALFEKVLLMSGAGPMPSSVAPSTSNVSLSGNARDYVQLATMLEAQAFAQDLKRAAIEAVQED